MLLRGQSLGADPKDLVRFRIGVFVLTIITGTIIFIFGILQSLEILLPASGFIANVTAAHFVLVLVIGTSVYIIRCLIWLKQATWNKVTLMRRILFKTLILLVVNLLEVLYFLAIVDFLAVPPYRNNDGYLLYSTLFNFKRLNKDSISVQI